MMVLHSTVQKDLNDTRVFPYKSIYIFVVV